MTALDLTIDLNDTPLVTIDLDIMEANILRMQQACDSYGVALRPHIKTHKIPALAHRQLEAGAKGIACQKLGEAQVMLDAGVDDILISYNIIGSAKLERLHTLAAGGRLHTVCDNAVVARGLSDTFREGDTSLSVLVECDTGTGRTGVQTPNEAVELAQLVSQLPGLRFAGLMTYPITANTAEFLEATYKALGRTGLHCAIVSTGGTPTVSSLGDVPGVTEHRAGTYIFNDRSCVVKGVASWDTCAMRVLATVVSRPTAERAILDTGSKSLSADTLGLEGYGHILEYPEAAIYRLNEEHGYVDLSAARRRPEVGEVVSVIPNHTCVVTNLHNRLVGVRADRVESVWPVAARGLVR